MNEPTTQTDNRNDNENVPATWPGAWGIYSLSRKAVMTNVWVIIGLFVAYYVVNFALQIIFPTHHTSYQANASLHYSYSNFYRNPLGTLLSLLLATWFTIASTRLFLASARRQARSFGEALRIDGAMYIRMLGLLLLTEFIAIVSLILLVIPFFFVMPRLFLAPYYLVDRKLGPVEALKASWHESQGHVGKVYGIVGVGIVFAVLLLVLVGFYLLLMYTAAAAILYLYVSNSAGKQSSEPVAVATDSAS